MPSSDRKSPHPSALRAPVEEEQFLCNEAIRTGAFDAISDSEWVALCERTAKDTKGRLAAECGKSGESV